MTVSVGVGVSVRVGVGVRVSVGVVLPCAEVVGTVMGAW